jgi:hypothetical protein
VSLVAGKVDGFILRSPLLAECQPTSLPAKRKPVIAAICGLAGLRFQDYGQTTPVGTASLLKPDHQVKENFHMITAYRSRPESLG